MLDRLLCSSVLALALSAPAAHADPTPVEAACDGGDLPSCVTAANALLCPGGGEFLQCMPSGPIPAADERRAADYFQRACDGNLLVGCRGVAALASQARAGLDRARAGTLFQRVCDGGDSWSCEQAGLQLEFSDKPIAHRASADWDRACRAGRPTSCVLLAALTEEKRSPLADDAIAPLATKACDGNIPAGCLELGLLSLDGRAGVPRDAARAATLLQRACQAGLRFACVCLDDPRHCRAIGSLRPDEVHSPGPECAARAVATLRARKITPFDLVNAWKLGHTGKLPDGKPDDPRRPDPAREPIWRELLLHFEPLVLYDDKNPDDRPAIAPGDLLVYAGNWVAPADEGLVLARGNLNPFTYALPVTMYQAAKPPEPSDAWHLSVDPAMARRRFLRPLFWWLRLKDRALCK